MDSDYGRQPEPDQDENNKDGSGIRHLFRAFGSTKLEMSNQYGCGNQYDSGVEMGNILNGGCTNEQSIGIGQ